MEALTWRLTALGPAPPAIFLEHGRSAVAPGNAASALKGERLAYFPEQVEDRDAIRAILGALAESEGLVCRAPPPMPALNASQAVATGA